MVGTAYISPTEFEYLIMICRYTQHQLVKDAGLLEIFSKFLKCPVKFRIWSEKKHLEKHGPRSEVKELGTLEKKCSVILELCFKMKRHQTEQNVNSMLTFFKYCHMGSVCL